MEPGTCLGDDRASEIAWRRQPGCRFSSAGISLVYWGTFYCLFAAAFSRPCHRCTRTVGTFATAAAPAFSDVVWPSGVRILCTALVQQSRGAELGRARFSKFCFARDHFLAAAFRGKRDLAISRRLRPRSGTSHEHAGFG